MGTNGGMPIIRADLSYHSARFLVTLDVSPPSVVYALIKEKVTLIILLVTKLLGIMWQLELNKAHFTATKRDKQRGRCLLSPVHHPSSDQDYPALLLLSSLHRLSVYSNPVVRHRLLPSKQH